MQRHGLGEMGSWMDGHGHILARRVETTIMRPLAHIYAYEFDDDSGNDV